MVNQPQHISMGREEGNGKRDQSCLGCRLDRGVCLEVHVRVLCVCSRVCVCTCICFEGSITDCGSSVEPL